MNIQNQFDLNQIVYLSTDPDQMPRMVTAITVRNHGLIYELSLASMVSWHSSAEISEDKTY